MVFQIENYYFSKPAARGRCDRWWRHPSHFLKGRMSIVISFTECMSKYHIMLAADPTNVLQNICSLKCPVSTRRTSQIGVMFVYEMSHNSRSVRWCKDCVNIFCGWWDTIFGNIKIWFSVIRYLMMSWNYVTLLTTTCYGLSMYQVWRICELCNYGFLFDKFHREGEENT